MLKIPYNVNDLDRSGNIVVKSEYNNQVLIFKYYLPNVTVKDVCH